MNPLIKIGAWLAAHLAPVVIALVIVGCLWGSGYVAGRADSKAECAQHNADTAQQQAQQAQQAVQGVIAQREEVERATAKLARQESNLRNAIANMVAANADLQKWLQSPVNPVLDAALYGLPNEAGNLPGNGRLFADPADTAARTAGKGDQPTGH